MHAKLVDELIRRRLFSTLDSVFTLPGYIHLAKRTIKDRLTGFQSLAATEYVIWRDWAELLPATWLQYRPFNELITLVCQYQAVKMANVIIANLRNLNDRSNIYYLLVKYIPCVVEMMTADKSFSKFIINLVLTGPLDQQEKHFLYLIMKEEKLCVQVIAAMKILCPLVKKNQIQRIQTKILEENIKTNNSR
jgi:hypothetical protein